ncbi:MAG: hypothetical protein OXC38_05900 [Gammaproteobacteria bacterium]|nr:hypothetical protein [Gammaproteobacteria bacterium]
MMIADEFEESDNDAEPSLYPLDEYELGLMSEASEIIRRIIQEHIPYMSAQMSFDISCLLQVFEQMPQRIPGMYLSFTFLTPGFSEGNYGWADVGVFGDSFNLGWGRHVYDDQVGGDTESETIFSTTAGTDGKKGNLEEWIRFFRELNVERLSCGENESDYEKIRYAIQYADAD